MKEAVTKVIDTLTQEDFHGAFQKLLERYNKCIAAGGDYFEGDKSFMRVLSIKVFIRKRSGNLSYAPRIWLGFFGLILWHINHYWLFNVNSSLYVYIKIYDLVWLCLVSWHINHCWLFKVKYFFYIYNSTDLMKDNGFKQAKEKKQKIPRKNNYERGLRRWHSASRKYSRPSRNPVAWSRTSSVWHRRPCQCRQDGIHVV